MVTQYILVIWAQLPLIPFSFKNKTIFQIKMDNLGYVDSESEEDDSSEDNQFNAEDIPRTLQPGELYGPKSVKAYNLVM